MRRLLQSLGGDWESNFVQYIADFWEDEIDVDDSLSRYDPLSIEIFRLEKEGKWPPENLREHRSIGDWLIDQSEEVSA